MMRRGVAILLAVILCVAIFAICGCKDSGPGAGEGQASANEIESKAMSGGTSVGNQAPNAPTTGGGEAATTDE